LPKPYETSGAAEVSPYLKEDAPRDLTKLIDAHGIKARPTPDVGRKRILQSERTQVERERLEREILDM